MDWLNKIFNWLKIPLKILLPALCVFSGFLIIASDDILIKLFLKEFRDNNGFAFGLTFVITLVLILIYFFVFVSKPLLIKIKNIYLRIETQKQILKMEEDEKQIIFGLFNEFDYAYCFPMNDATVNLLKSKGFLFTYQQTVNMLRYSSEPGVVYKLQPIVIWVLKDIKNKIVKKIDFLKVKAKKNKNKTKQQEFKKEISILENDLKEFNSFSLDRYYGFEKDNFYTNGIA